MKWGYKFNATAAVPSVFNAGTAAAPVGAAELNIDWEVKTVLQYTRQTESYYVDGTGALTQLGD